MVLISAIILINEQSIFKMKKHSLDPLLIVFIYWPWQFPIIKIWPAELKLACKGNDQIIIHINIIPPSLNYSPRALCISPLSIVEQLIGLPWSVRPAIKAVVFENLKFARERPALPPKADVCSALALAVCHPIICPVTF